MQNLTCWHASEGQYASSHQISWLSVKLLLRYGEF